VSRRQRVNSTSRKELEDQGRVGVNTLGAEMLREDGRPLSLPVFPIAVVGIPVYAVRVGWRLGLT
jgi:hypothetical protein